MRTTPDWTQYGETHDEHIERMERNHQKTRCAICGDKFEYDELENGICYECIEDSKQHE